MPDTAIEVLNTDILEDMFASAEGQGEAESVASTAFGFWLYIMSDCILFAALFATFVVLSRNYAGGPTGRELFDLRETLLETFSLLTSSVTCGFAMLALHREERGGVISWLAVTFLFGLGFVVMEVREFLHMAAIGSGPWRSGFLSAFFTLVGAHGTHVAIGLVWMAFMIVQILAKGLTASVQSRLLRLSMFWHFLDIIWVGVFTVVYLNGVY
ncbi:MAG TPA: cytochrome o ubiquinol oxidase subunit III [Acetobacteraceae bacterium]|nr:cytochrome o ubiquinol oxidase subunit III [Acetobacteraceae bacterium]